MRGRLVKLKRPMFTFFVCLLIALGMKVAMAQQPKYKVEPELEKYLKSFVNLADAVDINLDYIYQGDIFIQWAKHDLGTNVAVAYGRDKDGRVAIYVDKDKFMNRTEEGREYVMYHEFGHDILNFLHLEHPDRGMMEPTAYTGFFKNYERFTQERQYKYLARSLYKMFMRWKDKK